MRSLFVLLALSATSFHGCIAEWRGRSEGTINLNVGMTRAEAQRRSTIPLKEYGGSDYYFDFVLANEALRFKGINVYDISWENGKIERFRALSEKQIWSQARHDAQRAEMLLLERGWKRDPQTQSMSTLTDDARSAANAVNYDTTIRRTFYDKGDLRIELTACGLPGGIPWYRISRGEQVFWHAVGVYNR